MDTINQRLREVRKILGLNQEKFAKELGVSRTHISNMENGNDNPSSALIKLICMKYNIDENWLINGTGYPEPGWDMSNDEGAIAKYNAMRVDFEKRLRQRTGENLANTIEAFSYLESLISPRNLSEIETSEYLESVRQVIDEFEKLIFMVSSQARIPSKHNVKAWLKFKKDCDDKLNVINEHIKTAANLYLSHYGEEVKL